VTLPLQGHAATRPTEGIRNQIRSRWKVQGFGATIELGGRVERFAARIAPSVIQGFLNRGGVIGCAVALAP
jgi:hypothetical protein